MNRKLAFVENARRTLDQIASLRKGGQKISEACREVGIAEYTYYRWSRKLHRNGNHMEQETMTPSEAGIMLDEKADTPAEAKSKEQKYREKVAAVDALRATGESARQACKQMDIDEGTYFYWKQKVEGRLKRRLKSSEPQRRTREEIMALIRESNNRPKGESVKDWSDRKGVVPQALYGWRKRYGATPMEEAREIREVSGAKNEELKQLRIENTRLKMILADKCLDIQALQEYAGRK